ncbi:hypothetical protein [Roseibium sp.]|uniref:hypothetical protein n=1 Tax=Roseibium sp. TaxID=1936156 RepID=UPI003B527E80
MNYHRKMMNIQRREVGGWANKYIYGHRDARHDAAEIALNADAEIDALRKVNKALSEACEEFVRKVDAGEAKSKRSYAQMKAALHLNQNL